MAEFASNDQQWYLDYVRRRHGDYAADRVFYCLLPTGNEPWHAPHQTRPTMAELSTTPAKDQLSLLAQIVI